MIKMGSNSQTETSVDSYKRSERWKKQRQKILNVAGRLFAKKGYLGTSIEDIAKAVKVNKAIIYYYFENKSYLLYEVISDTLDELIAPAMQISKSNKRAEEKLRDLIKSHVQWQLTHYWLSGIGYVEIKNLSPRLRKTYITKRDQYENIFREVVKTGITQKEFRSCDPKLTTLIILGSINSIILWYRPGGRLSAMEISSQASDFIMHAVKAR